MSRYVSIGWVALDEKGKPSQTLPRKQWWGQPSLNAPRVYKSEGSAKRYGYPKEVFISTTEGDN